jgi:hypothetical protein
MRDESCACKSAQGGWIDDNGPKVTYHCSICSFFGHDKVFIEPIRTSETTVYISCDMWVLNPSMGMPRLFLGRLARRVWASGDQVRG